ncbi:unnamed protein product [Cladocopium goreaui]|uniref:Cilia- and flagella-associated protein 20 n=1 Tax=Cladocopium goreaui TaxID=2562237 RepID=A0A9P1DIT2_9DINO|nr:unnamed protein product [Cladocopium goreaui]
MAETKDPATYPTKVYSSSGSGWRRAKHRLAETNGACENSVHFDRGKLLSDMDRHGRGELQMGTRISDFCREHVMNKAVLLRQWLRGLQISVPNFEISQALSKLGVALNITGGRCRGLELEEFQLVDGSADPHQMAFTLQLDMGIHCLVNTTLQAIGPAKTCELEMETAAAVARVGCLSNMDCREKFQRLVRGCLRQNPPPLLSSCLFG